MDPEPVVALPGTVLIVPVGPHSAARFQGAHWVGPSRGQQARSGRARLRLHQRIVGHGLWCPDVAVLGDDVEIAQYGAGDFLRPKRLQPHAQPLHPGKRSEEHTSELQSLMRISYAVFCLKKKNKLSSISKTRSNKRYNATT